MKLFIHLGENIVVRSSDVITILDRQLLKSSSIVMEFIEKNSKQIIELANGDTKSIVVTADKIYFSPLSSSTLKKRAQHLLDIESNFEDEMSL